MDIQGLLAEREKTHGAFEKHAFYTQYFKEAYRNHDLCDEHRESLDMIMHKIGRILAGDPFVTDHWVDIAGYATLASQASPKSARRQALTKIVSESQERGEYDL